LAHGLQNGVLFRNPAAFDRLSSVEVYVFDESAGLERRRVEVTSVQTVVGVSAELVIGYVVAAYRKSRSERGRALADFASKRKTVHAKAEALAHYVGVTRYRDSAGRAIELATSQYLAAAQIEVPAQFKTAPAPHTRRTLRTKARGRRVEAATVVAADEKRSLRPLWVLRDGAVIGVVAFERSGDFVGAQVVAGLKARHKSARTVYVSQSGDAEAKALARRLGIDFAYGGLSREAKAGFIRDIGRKTMWIGDGSNPASKEAITVSTVSVSVAPLCHPQQDTADILLPEHGLDGLLDALKVGRAHKQRLADDYRTVYAANLLGVAGAFFARFSSLQAGLLSNVGTGLIYSRHARRLNRLASTVEAERARLKRSVPR
jgi:cation transport ATPase